MFINYIKDKEETKEVIQSNREAKSIKVEHEKGVKGPSIVATIPHFNWSTSFVTVYMHAILQGVAKMLFELWFDNTNSNEHLYIKKAVKAEIDDAIKKISPPDFITRTPRQLKHRKYWKASEIRDYYFIFR